MLAVKFIWHHAGVWICMTLFAPSNWIGVELFEAHGENNTPWKEGLIFAYPKSCGFLVQQTQRLRYVKD